MPRKYEPCLDYYHDFIWDDTPYASMRESPNGKWVPLKVFNDTTAQLRSENQMLKQLLNDKDQGDNNA